MPPSIYHSLSYDAFATTESLSIMMQKEQTIYKSCDYLQTAQGSIITVSDRLRLVDWCYSIVDKCEFDRENVAVAMDLVDRFLSTPSLVAREAMCYRGKFQLVAVTSLYIAIKVCEKKTIGSENFAAMSAGAYSVGDIEAMELNILEALSWRICAPNSVQVAHHILSLTLSFTSLQDSTWAFILDEIRFQCESAVRDYNLATQRPSTVALAAILNTLDQVGRQDRQAIFHALSIIINEEFDSPTVLVAVRNRLLLILEGNFAVAEDCPIVPDAPQSESRSYSSDVAIIPNYD